MKVKEMIDTHLSDYKFIIADSTGDIIFDENDGSYRDYKELKKKEVTCWGISNKEKNTIILYV